MTMKHQVSSNAVPDRQAHEEGLALFMGKDHRRRFLQSLPNSRLRQKLGKRLAHHADDFDERYAVSVEQHVLHAEFVEEVHRLLRQRGAPDGCFVLAPGNDLDGKETELSAALQELLTYGHGLISCLPGRLGLYVGEDGSPVLLLQRAARR